MQVGLMADQLKLFLKMTELIRKEVQKRLKNLLTSIAVMLLLELYFLML